MTYTSGLSGVGVVGETELIEMMFPTPEYYTTQSREVVLPTGHDLNPDGPTKTYKPFPIVRDKLSDKGGAQAVSLKLSMPTTIGLQGQILVGGEGLVEVKIIRGFGDALDDPDSFRRYWFQGTMTDLSIAGPLSTITVEDRRYILSKKNVPSLLVTRQCGNAIYETGSKNGRCDLIEADFTYSFIVDSITDGGKEVTLQSTASSGEDDPDVEGSPGKFSLGRAWLSANPSAQSFISGHSWDGSNATIQLHNPIVGLFAGSLVSVSWGCDWRRPTCKDRFSNFANYQGMPELPTVNPAIHATFNKND